MKKLIAFLLVFAMLAALPVLSASAAEAAEVTLIRTADELSAAKSGNYRLAADIDLGGHELIAALATISGTLDGNGHSIENFSLKIAEDGNNIGLFELSGDLTVKNLTVGSAKAPIAVSGGTLGQGGFAGILLRNTDIPDSDSNDGYNVTFENVDVYGDIASTGARAGGFVGRAQGGTVRFINCTMNGTIETDIGDAGNIGVGGFIGNLEGSASADFVQCINNADITVAAVDTNKDNKAAGYIGFVNTSGKVSVTNCINNGAVSSYNYAAGLFGQLYAAGTATVNGFWNNADITAAFQFAGSVFGRKQSANLTVTDAFHSGDIVSPKNFGGGLGGLNANALTVKNFLTYGTGTSDAPDPNYALCSGGTATENSYYCGQYADVSNLQKLAEYDENAASAVVEKLNSEGFLEGFRAVYGDFTEALTPVTSFATVEVAGWQTSTDGADLRLVGYVDAFGYASVGFELAVDGGAAYPKNDITTVYTTVSGAGKTYTAQSLADRAGYLYALVITDVPVGAQLTVTPTYTTQDGAVIKGQAVTVTMPAAE